MKWFLLFILVFSFKGLAETQSPLNYPDILIEIKALPIESKPSLKPEVSFSIGDTLVYTPQTQWLNSGRQGSLFIEGFNSDRYKVKLNGFSIKDPSLPGGGLQVFTLEPSLFAQVQLRGPGGLGQVLDIQSLTLHSKVGQGFRLQAGSYNERSAHISSIWGESHKKTQLALSWNQADGPSEVDGGDWDPYSQGTFLWTHHRELENKAYFSASLYHSQMRHDYDQFNLEDPNAQSESTQSLVGLYYLKHLASDLMWDLRWSYNFGNRKERNLADSYSSYVLRGDFNFSSYNLEWGVRKNLGPTVWGVNVDVETEKAKFQTQDSYSTEHFDKSQDSLLPEVYYQRIFDNKKLFVSLEGLCRGGGCSPSGYLMLEHHLENGRRNYISLAQTVKAPSLYQIHSNYGNSQLKEEVAQSFKLGREYLEEFKESHFYLFWTEVKSMIDYDFVQSRYENIGHSRFAGGHLSFQAQRFFSWWRLHYNFLEAKDIESQKDLPRRARHTLALGWEKDFLQSQWGLEWQHMIDRKDVDSMGNLVKMPNIHRWNLTFLKEFKSSQLRLKLRNLLNQRVSEVFGYYPEGITFQLSWESSY